MISRYVRTQKKRCQIRVWWTALLSFIGLSQPALALPTGPKKPKRGKTRNGPDLGRDEFIYIWERLGMGWGESIYEPAGRPEIGILRSRFQGSSRVGRSCMRGLVEAEGESWKCIYKKRNPMTARNTMHPGCTKRRKRANQRVSGDGDMRGDVV